MYIWKYCHCGSSKLSAGGDSSGDNVIQPDLTQPFFPPWVWRVLSIQQLAEAIADLLFADLRVVYGDSISRRDFWRASDALTKLGLDHLTASRKWSLPTFYDYQQRQQYAYDTPPAIRQVVNKIHLELPAVRQPTWSSPGFAPPVISHSVDINMLDRLAADWPAAAQVVVVFAFSATDLTAGNFNGNPSFLAGTAALTNAI